MDVWHYLSPEGRDLFQEWHDGLTDLRARVAVIRRIDRLAAGNTGDGRFCRSGVWELRIDLGPGLRVYYAIAGAGIVLLLGGGTKRTQRLDIERAVARWRDYGSRR
jgi:putative addiction module killer protein